MKQLTLINDRSRINQSVKQSGGHQRIKQGPLTNSPEAQLSSGYLKFCSILCRLQIPVGHKRQAYQKMWSRESNSKERCKNGCPKKLTMLHGKACADGLIARITKSVLQQGLLSLRSEEHDDGWGEAQNSQIPHPFSMTPIIES